MRSRYAALGAALIFVSGCLGVPLGGKSDEAFTIQPFRAGDRWLLSAMETENINGELGEPYPIEIEYAIGTAAVTDFDAYGHPTDCLPYFVTLRNFKDDPTGKEASGPDLSVRSCIETRSGTWMIHGGIGATTTARLHWPSILPGFPAFDDFNATFDVVPLYPMFAKRYDADLPNGQTLAPGRPVRVTSDAIGPNYLHQTTWELLRIGPAPHVPAPWSGEARIAQVMRHETVQIRATNETTLDMRERQWYAEGVPLPVLTERIAYPSCCNGTGDFTSLRSYDAGSGPLPVGAGSPMAQYNGTNPVGRFAPLGKLPDLREAGLEFSAEDALEWLRLDPMGLPAPAWLLVHDDAYPYQAMYFRDVQNRSYRWDFRLTDGQEILWAIVERETLASGIDVTQTLYAQTMSVRSGSLIPSPEAAASFSVVDGKTALALASQALPNGTAWTEFGWHFYDEVTYSGMVVSPREFYFHVGHYGKRHHDSSVLEHHEHTWSGLRRYVTGSEGRLQPNPEVFQIIRTTIGVHL